VVFVKLSRQCHSGIVVGVQPLDQYEFKRPKEVDMGHCERVIQVEEQPAKPKLDISLPEESMTNHEKLMKELELMSALKDHTDPSDTNPLRVSLNKAWDVVRDRAAKAADDYVANPEG
jgi:hypothetical protein